jgi:predicted amino acid-binding ACT domain protein
VESSRRPSLSPSEASSAGASTLYDVPWEVKLMNTMINDDGNEMGEDRRWSRCTEVQITGPDISGFLRAVTQRLDSLGCNVIATSGAPADSQEHKIHDVFYIQHEGDALDVSKHARLEAALVDACATLTAEVKLHRGQFDVSVSDDIRRPGKASSVHVVGPDVPGLLHAIAQTLADRRYAVLDFQGLTTPSGQVRDRFTVSTRDGHAVEPAMYRALTARLKDVCVGLCMTEQIRKNQEEGGAEAGAGAGADLATPLHLSDEPLTVSVHPSHAGGGGGANGAVNARRESAYTVEVHNDGGGLPSMKSKGDPQGEQPVTTVSVVGPDVPGLLSRLVSELTADGYAVISFRGERYFRSSGGGSALPSTSGSFNSKEPQGMPPPAAPDADGAEDSFHSCCSTVLNGASGSFRSESKSQEGKSQRTIRDVFLITRDGQQLPPAECTKLRGRLSEKLDELAADLGQQDARGRATSGGARGGSDSARRRRASQEKALDGSVHGSVNDATSESGPGGVTGGAAAEQAEAHAEVQHTTECNLTRYIQARISAQMVERERALRRLQVHGTVAPGVEGGAGDANGEAHSVLSRVGSTESFEQMRAARRHAQFASRNKYRCWCMLGEAEIDVRQRELLQWKDKAATLAGVKAPGGEAPPPTPTADAVLAAHEQFIAWAETGQAPLELPKRML